MLTVVLSLVLTGCFGGEDEEGPTTDTPEETTTPPPPPTQAPTTAPSTVVTASIPDPLPPNPPPPEPPIPDPPPPDPPRPDGQPLVYTVEQGDTLYAISRKFEVSVDDLIATNNIANPDSIFAGETLVIPPSG